jgi:hypothetical protein
LCRASIRLARLVYFSPTYPVAVTVDSQNTANLRKRNND